MTLASVDFFVLRTSHLSEEHFFEICRSADRSSLLMSDNIASVIKVASSGLYATMQHETRSGADGQLSEKSETSALRTILRASTRATPYGLSSTSSLGTIGSADELSIGRDDRFFGNLELGGEALSAIIDHINEINIKQKSAYISLNPSIYTVGDRLRYIICDSNSVGAYRYCEKSISKVDVILIKFLQERRRLWELNEFLSDETPPQPNYIEEMLAGGLLVPELALPMYRRDGLAFLTHYLRNNHPELDLELRTLDALATRLAGANGFSLTNLEAVEHAVTATKEKIGLKLQDNNTSPFLIDATRKMKSCQLSRETADSLVGAAHTLMQKTMRPTLLHEKLARKISERFGDEAVPIGYLVDPKYGIAFDPGSLADFPVAEASGRYETELSAFLVGEMVNRAGSINLERFERSVKIGTCFPKGAVLAQMRIEDGKPGFSISSISGPEGMELFSRSCLVDGKTEQLARSFAAHSDFGAAERLDLAHIPSAYGWHATMRPDYWPRRIAFPGVYVDGPKLSCDDAFARVENGIIVLRDRAGKKLLPRVSSAHDMLNAENLPLYRALAIIGVPYAVGFRWPSIFSDVKQLPRVMLGDVWLSPAQWQLTDMERRAICSSASTSTTLRAILKKRGIKGEIEVGSGDRFLPVLDFSDASLSVVMPVLKARDTVIRERFFTSKATVFQEKEANCAEVVLPFFSREENREPEEPHFDLGNYSFQATSPHLGNWISFKIYGPRQDMDRNVLNGLATLTERIKDQDYVDQWFFLRFGDPEFHLRFRVKVTSLEYRSDIVSVLGEFLDQLADRCLIDRWELVTYRPELMRYGGTRTMPVCEQIFATDSKACWIVNRTGESDRGLALTRHLVNANVLLDRLELIGQTGTMAVDTLSKWQEFYRGSVPELEAVRAEANKTLNDNRVLLEAELSDLIPEEAFTACCASRQFVAKLRSEAEGMRTTIDGVALLESLFHMFSNRLYPDWSRRKELMALCIAKRLLNFKIHRAAS